MVRFAVVLTVAMASATFMGAALAVLAPFLVAEFDVSRAGLGWLFTGGAAVAAVGSVAAGSVTDRVGGRRVLSALYVLSIVGILTAAVAPTYAWLVLAALVAGLPNAAGNPGTNKLIALHTPPSRRGTVIGTKQSGVAVSVFLAGSALPFGAETIGWRPSLALMSIIPLVGLYATARVVPPDPSLPRTQGSRMRRRVPQPTAIRWIAVYGFLMGAGGAVTFSYLPLYAYEVVGLSTAAAGGSAAALGLVAVGARFAWSWWAGRGSDFTRPLGALALASVAATVAIWASPATGPWLLWAGALAAGASVAAWNAVGMLAVVVISDVADAGRASGLVLSGFLGGFTVSPVLFGYAADATGGYDLGWAVTTVVLGAAVLVTWRWRATAPAVPVPDGAHPARRPTVAWPRLRGRRGRAR
jgi:predicted MFS family arabinose efflux permease